MIIIDGDLLVPQMKNLRELSETTMPYCRMTKFHTITLNLEDRDHHDDDDDGDVVGSGSSSRATLARSHISLATCGA